jgi:hypothetical protein
MAVSMEITAFWDTTLCSLFELDRRFIGATASVIIVLMMEAVRTSEYVTCYLCPCYSVPKIISSSDGVIHE